MLWIVTRGTSLVFKAGWFQVVIVVDFWMCGLVVFRVCYKTWQPISAASQYEIWIPVSSASWDQRDNQDLLCNDVMTVNMVKLYTKNSSHRQIHKLWFLTYHHFHLISSEFCPFFICCCSNVTVWLTHVSFQPAAHRSGLQALQLGRSLWTGWDGEGATRVPSPAPLQRPHASRRLQAQTAGDEDRRRRQTPRPSPRPWQRPRQRQWWVHVMCDNCVTVFDLFSVCNPLHF